jgi:hypothetical protein
MESAECLRVSDPAVVARYLLVRSVLHDRHLARVERLILERYDVAPTRRIHPTLVSDVRSGFVRPGEGEMWPVVLLTAVDVTVALYVEISPERVAGLGTMLNGPQRVRHRGWEDDWWGWESPLTGLHPQFFERTAAEQEEAVVTWFTTGLEWLVGSGLLRRRPC